MGREKSEAVSLASARHGQLRRSSGWANAGKMLLTAFIVLVLSGVSVAAYAAWGLGTKLDTVQLASGPSEGDDQGPAVGAAAQSVDGELTVLLVGSDSREGSILDDGETGELNDVNLLLHVSADHQNATVISFPRDLKVPIPSCPDGEGGYYSAMSEQMINTAISYGGLSCVALTIAKLTGMDIPYAAKVTFDGVIAMSNAIGGVTVCLTEPIEDAYTGLSLPAGDNTLAGLDALQFLRTRHGVGNGGDTSRISNQQVFMSAMVRQLRSADTLSNPLKVYGLAKAAIENVQLSDNMASTSFLQQLAGTVKDIDLSRINFVQYPSLPHPYEAGRLTPNYALADELIDLVVSGQPFEVSDRGEGVVDPNADPGTQTPPPADGTTDPTAPPTTAGPTTDPTTGQPPADGSTETPSGPVVLPEGITGQSAGDQTCSAGRTVY